MGKYGIATNPNVAPTGYALAHDEVWVNGIKQEVTLDEADLDRRIIAAGTAGIIAIDTIGIVIDSPEDSTAA